MSGGQARRSCTITPRKRRRVDHPLRPDIARDVVGVVAIQCFGMLKAVAIANYRSLRHIVIPLQNLNVLTGANGSGKSSLYRALRLLADTAQGRVVSSLAREGGLQPLWAGPDSISCSMKRGDHPV